MAEPFLGEIRPFSFNVTPKGWMPCSGQTLSINTNQALFALLGTTYGGNGTTTFMLPDLRSRFALAAGSGISLGQMAGESGHTLLTAEMPAHFHTMQGSSNTANTGTPTNSWPAGSSGKATYASTADTTLGTGSSGGGGNQPHPNLSPFLAINFCIAIQGIYPPRN